MRFEETEFQLELLEADTNNPDYNAERLFETFGIISDDYLLITATVIYSKDDEGNYNFSVEVNPNMEMATTIGFGSDADFVVSLLFSLMKAKGTTKGDFYADAFIDKSKESMARPLYQICW